MLRFSDSGYNKSICEEVANLEAWCDFQNVYLSRVEAGPSEAWHGSILLRLGDYLRWAWVDRWFSRHDTPPQTTILVAVALAHMMRRGHILVFIFRRLLFGRATSVFSDRFL